MSHRYFRKSLIAFSILGWLGAGIVWACGWWEPDVSETSAFAPESFAGRQYTPFFYEPDYPFYGDESYNYNTSGRLDQSAVQDWKTYLRRSDEDTMVAHFLLSASAGLADSVLKLDAVQLPQPYSSMELVRRKSDKKIAAFFRFLSFAKANEAYAIGPSDYWGYEPVPTPNLDATDKMRIGEMIAEMKRSKDAFIRQRYCFQIVRAYYFAQQYEACIRFYEEQEHTLDKSLFASRIAGYRAGALYKLKQFGAANYYYSRIFAAHPEQRLMAEYSFHPQEEADWKESLALCKNNEEREGMWVLMGIYNDEQRAIGEIYRMNPRSDKLDLLLSRLVNITEASSAGDGADRQERNEGKDGAFLAVNAERLKTSVAIVEPIAAAHNTLHPFAWHMALGYLYFLQGDTQRAAQQYGAAKSQMPADVMSGDQLRLLQLMNHAFAAKEMNTAQEQALLPELQWANKAVSDTAKARLRIAGAYSWIKGLFSDRYRLKGNLLYAELYRQDLNYYNDPARAQKLKEFLRSETLSPYGQYLRSIYPFSAEDVAEVQGIVAAYKDQLPQAIQLMREMPVSVQEQLPGNPFNNRIQDCHDCDHAAPQKVKYTKLSLLEKMQEMRTSINAGKDVYNNALLLGSAFYNMSIFGNARAFYQSAITGEVQFAGDFSSELFSEMVLSQAQAIRYLQIALKAAGDDEQRAKVTYLLLKCERNEYYTKRAGNNEDIDGIPPIRYASLFPFARTRYYQEVLQECGYFRTAASGRK